MSRSVRKQPSAPRDISKRGVGWHAQSWWKDAPQGADERAEPREHFKPKAGPGQVLVEEGERNQRHYRNVGHALDLALNRKQITQELWVAGHTFWAHYEIQNGRSGKDSSQALMAPGGSNGSVNCVQAAVDAGEALAKIKAVMPARSYRIVEYFCGKGLSMTESVQRVTSCHPSTCKYRIVEALEELEDALDRAKVRRAA